MITSTKDSISFLLNSKSGHCNLNAGVPGLFLFSSAFNQGSMPDQTLANGLFSRHQVFSII